jgi:hypothetical protein
MRHVEVDVYGVDFGAHTGSCVFKEQAGLVGMKVVGFNLQSRNAHVKDGAGINGEVDFAGYVVYDFGYHAVDFLNTVELNFDMFGGVVMLYISALEAMP